MQTDLLLSAEPENQLPRWADGSENDADPTAHGFEIESLVVDPQVRFDLHYHSKDQLTWMPGGAMELTVGGTRWHLRRDRFVWIPAGTLHEMGFTEPGEVINLYTDVRLRPSGDRWTRACVVEADELASGVLWHLVDQPRGLARRRLCLSLLRDLLQTAAVSHDTLALPTDPRAQRIAVRLLAEPADDRELADWARELRVSERTLTRAFVSSAGCTFRQWRQSVRMHAAAGLLARGERVAAVAERVGYATPSSFIAAFAERFGTTPLAYARQHRA